MYSRLVCTRPMFREDYISSEDEQAWHDALSRVPHAFAHTFGCCRAIQRTHLWPTFLYTATTGASQMICPVAERAVGDVIDLATPFQFSGFSRRGDPGDLHLRWQAFARGRGAVAAYHVLHPVMPSDGCFSPDDRVERGTLHLLDLTASSEDLLSGFDRSRRRQLRTYDGQLRDVVTDRQELADFLVAAYPAFAERVQASQANRYTEATLRQLVALDGTVWVGMRRDGAIRAAYGFGMTPFVGDCLLNVATPEGRSFSTVLLWYGILALKARNVPVLNLGGGLRDGDSLDLAKRRFRGRQVPFRAVKEVLRRDVYRQLCQRAGADPDSRDGYFPAYRQP